MILPAAPATYQKADQDAAREEMRQADDQNRKTGQDIELTTDRLILRSPDGSRFALSVDNAGTLSAVAL